MKLQEAIEKVNKIRLNFYDKQYKKSYTDDELTDMCDSLSTILQYIKYDSIPKKKIKNEIEILKAQCGGNVFHIQQTLNAEIRLLQELLEDK